MRTTAAALVTAALLVLPAAPAMAAPNDRVIPGPGAVNACKVAFAVDGAAAANPHFDLQRYRHGCPPLVTTPGDDIVLDS